MDIIAASIDSFVVSLLLAVIVFVMAYLRHRRYDLIDVAWGLFFIAIAWSGIYFRNEFSFSELVVGAAVAVWGLRLAWHVFVRWQHANSEDPRYVALRKSWPTRAIGLQVFLRIYAVQALLAVVVSLPVIVMVYSGLPLAENPLFWVGMAVWLFGLVFEAVADSQLSRFLANNTKNGALMMNGLWRYSRHPNYFGEITLWWGLAIASFSTEYGWVGVLGALTITLLIRFISGVPPAERRAATKPKWKAYATRTRMLLPLPR